jgi:hypothetical protein
MGGLRTTRSTDEFLPVIEPTGALDGSATIRSTAMSSMNEQLALARMRDAASGRSRRGAKRPARLVAMSVARIRNRY